MIYLLFFVVVLLAAIKVVVAPFVLSKFYASRFHHLKRIVDDNMLKGCYILKEVTFLDMLDMSN